MRLTTKIEDSQLPSLEKKNFFFKDGQENNIITLQLLKTLKILLTRHLQYVSLLLYLLQFTCVSSKETVTVLFSHAVLYILMSWFFKSVS